MESVLVKLADVEVGDNHRSRMDPKGLQDLAASIKAVGVLQPLIVRPLPLARPGKGEGRRYGLVAGHRRYKAAELAGLEAVPCVSFPFADDAVVQVQLIENIQRKDPHPLDEADAYRMLRDDGKVPVADIAARVGKSPQYVAQRLVLSALVEPARGAFRKGRLEAGAALVLARIADPKDQKKAAATVLQYARDDGAIGMAEAARVVRREYMLDLAQAPFDVKEAVAGVGPCGGCPKRTGANPDLFGDIPDKDLCSDGGCFRRKADAAWEARAREHNAAGGKVLTAAEAKKLFPYDSGSLAHDAGMVDLDAVTHDFSQKGRTWRSLVGRHVPEGFVTVLARTPDGRAVELLSREALAAGLKAAGLKQPSRAVEGSSAQTRAARKRERAKADEHKALFHARLAAIVAKYGKVTPPRAGLAKLFRVLAFDLCAAGGSHDALRDWAKAQGIEVPKTKDGSGGPSAAVKAWAQGQASDGDLQALLLYAACYGYGASAFGGAGETMKHAAKALGVDLAAVKAEKPAKAAGRKAAARKPRKRGKK